MVAVDQRLSYRGELYAGDVISVRSAIIELGSSSVRFVHEMQRDETGEHVATSMLKGVHIDTVARRSCPLPEELRDSARKLLVADPSPWDTWPPPRAFAGLVVAGVITRAKHRTSPFQLLHPSVSPHFFPRHRPQATDSQNCSIFFRIAASGRRPRPAA
jgi:hypothetical protein